MTNALKSQIAVTPSGHVALQLDNETGRIGAELTPDEAFEIGIDLLAAALANRKILAEFAALEARLSTKLVEGAAFGLDLTLGGVGKVRIVFTPDVALSLGLQLAPPAGEA